MYKVMDVSPILRQILTVVCCNLVGFSFGTQAGWATINFEELQNENTKSPTGKLTLNEASIVVTSMNIGGLIGNFGVASLSKRFGVKRVIHCMGIPLVASVLLIIWAQNVYYLYISRILAGFVCGASVIAVPTFATQISFDRIRGALNSLFHPSNNLGMLFSFFLGTQFDCMVQAKIQLIVPTLFILFCFCFPESPAYHASQNNLLEAAKSHAFFKGNESFDLNGGHMMRDAGENLTLKDFMNPRAKRAMFLSFTISFLSYASGSFVMLNYATIIFANTGSTMSEKSSSLLITIVLVATNIVFSSVVEHFKRRTLFIWSSIATAMAYFLFGLHGLLWTKNPDMQWMPPLCFSLIIFAGCFGIVPIAYVFTMEIFPNKIRGACASVSMSFYWFALLFIGSAFPNTVAVVGISTYMFGFGIVCLLAAAFGIWFMPETRGISYEEIMELLDKQKSSP